MENSFIASDLIFNNAEETNKCMEMNGKEGSQVDYTIMNKNVKGKSVIANWDGLIEDLTEALDKRKKIRPVLFRYTGAIS